MDSIKVLHITTHLGGGLGTAIGSYITQSELKHSVLELEKSLNPCTDQFHLSVTTLPKNKELAPFMMDYEVVLFHYYCHPLIAWALLEMNSFPEHKVVVWCHNNGKDCLHPLPDDLNDMADLVILSGCKDDRFRECDVIRPAPLAVSLDDAAKRLFMISMKEPLSFRYIGSLDESKIHECADEWFTYLSEHWKFDIATLDTHHKFLKFNIHIGETQRSALYDHFFCVVYPLQENHYGCGELGLQELLMLGYPVIIRRNSVELEIVEGLSGVYLAESMNELHSVCSEIAANWHTFIDNWRDRSTHNMKIIASRNPYHTLDLQLDRVYRRPLRSTILRKTRAIDIVKFAYNQRSDSGLKTILRLWKQSGRDNIPTKGSPAQFVKYFPDLQSVFSSLL